MRSIKSLTANFGIDSLSSRHRGSDLEADSAEEVTSATESMPSRFTFEVKESRVNVKEPVDLKRYF